MNENDLLNMNEDKPLTDEYVIADYKVHVTGTRFIGRMQAYTSQLEELVIDEWSPTGKYVKVRGVWTDSAPLVHEVLPVKDV